LGYIGIVGGRLYLGGEQLQLLGFAVFVEDLNRFQPTRLSRIVQLAEITQRSLPRSIRGADGFHQRPVAVWFAVLDSAVGPQKHFCLMVS
jgi:hypothetical protein